MTLQDLHTLLDFHYWARDRMLDAVAAVTPEQYTKNLGSSFGSIRDTLVHTYSAEWAWCRRWHGESPTTRPAAEQFPDVASLRAMWAQQEGETRAFLASLGEPGVTRTFDYMMLSGEPATSVFWHMLQHVVNHASYHRGQVTTMLRQQGASPGKSTDMVTFYRERGA